MDHPDKHIREAIKYAIGNGWRFVKAGPRAHIYGTLLCGQGHGGCAIRVHCTPRNPKNHAKRIKKAVDRCPGT